ncbi:MAG: hypothetical protein P1Q69_04380 [Candidatus Thorarchaeota archaeon]|nr:hypothetical protein [Candidatus Thorarchaeota archaeon]
MQSESRYASESIVAVLNIVAAVILVISTENRTRTLPEDETNIGIPLYASAIFMVLFGIASFINYLINFGNWSVDPLLTSFQSSIMAPGLLTIAGFLHLAAAGGNLVTPLGGVFILLTSQYGFLL